MHGSRGALLVLICEPNLYITVHLFVVSALTTNKEQELSKGILRLEVAFDLKFGDLLINRVVQSSKYLSARNFYTEHSNQLSLENNACNLASYFRQIY